MHTFREVETAEIVIIQGVARIGPNLFPEHFDTFLVVDRAEISTGFERTLQTSYGTLATRILTSKIIPVLIYINFPNISTLILNFHHKKQENGKYI